MLTLQTETDQISKAGTTILSERKLDFGKLRKEIGHIVNDYAECEARQMPYK